MMHPPETAGTSNLIFRLGTVADAAPIASIYNDYVTASTATFDTEPHSVAHRERWLTDRSPSHPIFVAEQDGEVLGWGALSPYRERPAWRHTVEVALYVGADARGRGIGPRLLQKLIEAADEIGHHAIVAQVTAENETSIRTLERAGFVTVGTLIEVGRKFHRWLDVAIMEYQLEQRRSVE